MAPSSPGADIDAGTRAKEADGRSIYADFDAFLKVALKEYYDRGWTSRRGNFIALLIASGQTALSMAKDSIVDGTGTKKVAIGAALVLALRIGLKYALGGPLGAVLTIAAGASMVSYFIRNQKDIVKKVIDGDSVTPVETPYPPSMIKTAIYMTVANLIGQAPVRGHVKLDAPLITQANAKEYYFPDSPF